MTKIEEQALRVSHAWRRYTEIDRRLAEGREAKQQRGPLRSHEEREQDAHEVRPACAAYKKELEILAQMVL